MRTIALISCCKIKRPHRSRAIDLYEGQLFKKTLQYVRSRLNIPDRDIYILSAKHGLVSHEKEIDPYEESLNGKGVEHVRLWSQRVIEQLGRVANLEADFFYIFAGRVYHKNLIPHLIHKKIPLENMRNGKQLGRLKSWLS